MLTLGLLDHSPVTKMRISQIGSLLCGTGGYLCLRTFFLKYIFQELYNIIRLDFNSITGKFLKDLQNYCLELPSMALQLICGQLGAYLLSFFMGNLYYQGKMRFLIFRDFISSWFTDGLTF